MRRADCRERRRVRRHPQFTDSVARIQSPLGVCDNIDLFTAGLLHHLQNFLSNVLCITGNGSQGLLIAIVDRRPISHQFTRNSSPIVKVMKIAETDTVHHDERILRPAQI